MKIAVLSGKGGTGKTIVSASLSAVNQKSQYVDCNVEEPGGYVFLKPDLRHSVPVHVAVPDIDEEICSGCGDCAGACRFHALTGADKQIRLSPEICRHCGACYMVCKPGALTVSERTVGVIETNDDRTFVQGRLNIGEFSAEPVIKKIREYIREDVASILDCSPGMSAGVIQSLRGCDYCLLVTEPTPFALHDLKIAVSVVKRLGIRFGIVINKAYADYSPVRDFCENEGIEILLEIPFSEDIAAGYADGILPVANNPEQTECYINLYRNIRERAGK